MAFRKTGLATFFSIAAAALFFASPARAASAGEIDRKADAALKNLYATQPVAAVLGKSAKGILVFPKIVKGGFIVGGQYGDGALRKDGKTVGYYNSTAASYGLQAGVQSFGYVMMFLSDDALRYLDRSSGWEVGVGPSVVVVDQGIASSLTTTTAKSDVYVFFFNQKGLMAGLGVQGSKITKIYPPKDKKK
jgi:lipid-binding SYLF domain-containing protein